MASTSSVEKSQEAPQGEIEKLEAALKAAHEKFQKAQKALKAAQEEITKLKANQCPDELEVFVWGYDTPVIFHPRLRSKAINAWYAVASEKTEGNLETVYMVKTDEQWDSFFEYGKGEAPSWAFMMPSDVEDDDEDDEK